MEPTSSQILRKPAIHRALWRGPLSLLVGGIVLTFASSQTYRRSVKTALASLSLLALGASFAPAQTFHDIHDFGGPIVNAGGSFGSDGLVPTGNVAFDTQGNMYGTASGGGSEDMGMLWELTTTGTYLDLHDFGGTTTNSSGSGGPDGQQPDNVVVDADGNIFGTAGYGGSNGDGIVWELTQKRIYRDLHDFGGTVTNSDGSSGFDGTYPVGGVTLDATGNLYGTSSLGGPNFDGIVWKLDTSGNYSDLHDFSGPDGNSPSAPVAFDGAVNMYGTTQSGGSSDGGTIWEITAAGAFRLLHSFGGQVINANGKSGPDGTYPLAAVTVDRAGNLYGTASAGGPMAVGTNDGYGMAWEITSAGLYTDLHDFGGMVTNSDGTNGPDGTEPQSSITIDSAGDLIGTALLGGPKNPANGGAGLLWKISKAGDYVDLFDFGGQTVNADGSTGPGASFPAAAVTLDQAGNMYGTAETGGPYQDSYGNTLGMAWMITSYAIRSLSLSPTSMTGGLSSTGTVTLTSAAPVNGVVVQLGSVAPGVTIPESVTVPEGQSSAKFAVRTTAVSKTEAAQIVAVLDGAWATATLTVNPPVLSSISLSPSSVIGAATSTGTVTLDGASPAGGTVVNLSSSSAAASVPASVRVLAGETTATFTAKTIPVATSTAAVITAKFGTVSKTGTLTVKAPALTSVTLAAGTILGGATAAGTVTLTGAAPTGGVVVDLSSSSSAAKVPASVIVPAGKSAVTFTLTSSPVASNTAVTITAKSSSVSTTAKITIDAPVLTSLTLNPTSVIGGTSSTGTVTINGAAPASGFAVTLSSSSSSATVSSSVVISAGKSSATITVTTKKVTTQATATITGKAGSVSKTASLTVKV